MRICKLFNYFLLFFLATGCGVAIGSTVFHGPHANIYRDPAKEIHVEVKLLDIKAEKTSEEDGDELYFNITHYSNLRHPAESRVPASPAHWLSEQLPGVKNVVLWSGTVHEGETVRLIFSLGEQDKFPWNEDDLLGSAQLVLTNEAGKLNKIWALPAVNKKDEAEMLKKGDPQRFLFKGDGSLYDVAFLVEQKKK